MMRKGITPIIAVVLLLMMTVAAAGLAYQFVINAQTGVQAGLEQEIAGTQAQSQAKLTIDTVYNTTTDVVISLRNSGSYTFNTGDLSVYIDGRPFTTAVFAPAGTFSPKSTITVTVAGQWPAVGVSKAIRIIPAVGNPVSYTCTNTGKNFC